MKICPEENYLARRCFGEMKLDNKIPLGKCVLVLVIICIMESLPQAVQDIFATVHATFGND